MISYFVSFAVRGGFGCTQVDLRLPVRGMPDVNVLAEILSAKQGEPVVILNFQRFEPAAPSADQPVTATTTPGEPS